MITKCIVNGGVTMGIESYETSNEVTVYIDDPESLCMDNGYNGNYASIELSIDNVKELHAHLTKLLEVKGAL